ncbi:Mediator of RNA polymerase II transcription subunit 31 [Terramyces sp. JEL0728]|nr:Mediator of RNA polymerase II transcription subunit 31 [Terramyces sp. JEL0728]
MDEKRFQVELEFVQCLSNPQYLQFLAQQRIFEKESFINYLKYLQYFQTPKYAKYVVFPYCLHLLDLLQHESFRKACASADTVNFLHQKQYKHWEAFIKENSVPNPLEEKNN